MKQRNFLLKIIFSLAMVVGLGNFAKAQTCLSLFCPTSTWPCPIYIIDNPPNCVVSGFTVYPESCPSCGSDTTHIEATWAGNLTGNWCQGTPPGCPLLPQCIPYVAAPYNPGMTVIGDCCDCATALWWTYLGVAYHLDLTTTGLAPGTHIGGGSFMDPCCPVGIAHFEYVGVISSTDPCYPNFTVGATGIPYGGIINEYRVVCGAF